MGIHLEKRENKGNLESEENQIIIVLKYKKNYWDGWKIIETVDGWNPAPPGMYKTL